MTELDEKVICWIVALALLIGAVLCVRDGVEFYRERPSDGIYKLPLTAAIVLMLIAALAIFLA